MDAETARLVSSNVVWLSVFEPCQHLLAVMALVLSSATSLSRRALGVPSKVSPWVFPSSGLACWLSQALADKGPAKKKPGNT